MEKPNKNDLRVWHIPQIPMNGFFVPVKSPEEGKRIMDILGDYDIFQFENNIKPDYSNASGLEVFDGDGWCDWESEDGENIDAYELDSEGKLKLVE